MVLKGVQGAWNPKIRHGRHQGVLFVVPHTAGTAPASSGGPKSGGPPGEVHVCARIRFGAGVPLPANAIELLINRSEGNSVNLPLDGRNHTVKIENTARTTGHHNVNSGSGNR